jgi:hypothetical protein
MSHLAASSALAAPALSLAQSLTANAQTLKRNNKSAILLWMGGGPPTIDMFDMKPGAATGGPLQPIATTGEGQICEKLPLLAQQMKHLAIIRSMSTREADHQRGRYYMHTGYVPNPNIKHPSYGAVVSRELADQVPHLEIPPFISIGGPSEGPGFLGMAFAPFQVDASGNVRNLDMQVEKERMLDRMKMLAVLERRFIRERRGASPEDHAKVLEKTRALMTSDQMAAFRIEREAQNVRERYGTTGFGRSCLMARRLIETGVPFVEVDFGGWDLHNGCFTGLDQKLPELDRAMSALVTDLAERDLLQDTVVLWMGEFGRTPRINGNAGRDHWARSWSVVVGGGTIQGGKVVGATNDDGTRITTEPFSSEDLMATVCRAMGISLNTTFTSNNGRPMKIANGGKVIEDVCG